MISGGGTVAVGGMKQVVWQGDIVELVAVVSDTLAVKADRRILRKRGYPYVAFKRETAQADGVDLTEPEKY